MRSHRPKQSRVRIRGSGGDDSGDNQKHSPVEDPDTLRSKAFVRIVDLLSEGEIEGLVNGAKSIYLDKVVLQNSDGSYNFPAVSYESRNGTQGQSYIPGFNSVENEQSVNVEVKYGDGSSDFHIVRQITNPNVDRVRVRVMVPQLSQTDTSTGDVHGTSVSVSLWIQADGGPYVLATTREIRGKSSSRYQVDLSAELTGSAPWNVKLVRNSADSNNQYLSNKTYFESYVEVIDAKLRYPNSAIVAMRLDAQAFQNIPTRYYDVKLLKIQIPSNYDPETRAYTGSWDGTFQTAWSDNPAWVFYDLATNARYGLGDFIPAEQVDKWALYEIAQYCDELVPDGFGETEPRFTCNLLLDNRGEAYQVMQSLASVFRGMIYWAAGAVTFSQDAPQDAAYLFTPANVVDGKFTYQGASAKARHSVVNVAWNDPEDFYRRKVEYVEDQTAIASFGVQQTEVVAFGCTSRGQAHRLGKWLLYTEQNESETVLFKTGVEGIVSRPGQVIKIADPARAGIRMGGRILAATTSTITVDQEPSASVSGNLLSVMLSDGTVEERTVTGQVGNVLTVQPAYSAAPQVMAIWVLKSSTVEPQTFRVISIKEENGGVFAVSALRHDPDKYAAVEDGVQLEPKSYSVLTAAPSAPENIDVSESLYQSSSEVRAKITVSWDKVSRAVSYLVRYRKDNENFIELPETQFNDVEILDVNPGTFEFQVVAIGSTGKRSTATTATQEIYGKTSPPGNVQNFSMIPNAGQAYLTWDKSVDLDVLVGGEIRVRHTPRVTAQAWKDGVDIIPALNGTATSAVAPLLAGTYMAKFIDSSGNYSEIESMIVTTVPYAQAQNIVETVTEDPAFTGTKTNMRIDAIESALVLTSGTLVDDYPLIDDVGDWEYQGDVAASGTYEFAGTTDLGAVYPTRISSEIDLEAFDVGNLIDSHTDPIDSWEDIDGAAVNDVNAQLYVRTTEDDPNATPTWTDWKLIRAGEYNARAFQFKLICTSGNPDHNFYIRTLEVVLDMADRVINVGPYSSGTGASYRVTYGNPFYAAPVIGITAPALASGDYMTITNEDETGFDIVFKNSGGTIVNRSFYVLAKGYGRQVA